VKEEVGSGINISGGYVRINGDLIGGNVIFVAHPISTVAKMD